MRYRVYFYDVGFDVVYGNVQAFRRRASDPVSRLNQANTHQARKQ